MNNIKLPPKEHYQRCKDAILSYCIEGNAFRALIGDHSHWWKKDKEKGTAKLFYPDNEDYDELTSKYRTLYWTAQLFPTETANIEKIYNFEKGKITEQIGGREDTFYHSFFLDLDKAKGKDIHDSGVIEWLEKGIKFFADKLLDAGVESFGLAFSGGGVYCILHPRLGMIAEDEKDRVYKIEIIQRAFDLFIGDVASEFFEKNPEAIEYVKFDKLNYDKKRQVKTILSIHKKQPYAVIPLDTSNPKIDLEEAALPISDETIEKAKKWFVYQDDIDNFGDLLKPWMDKAKETIKKKHGTRTVNLETEEIDEDNWAPCIRNIITKTDLKSGAGGTRALSVLASYLRYVGVPEEKAFDIFNRKAEDWDAETSNLFERWYGCEHLDTPTCFVPSCEKIRAKGSGYPHPELGELEVCTPDERCKKIRSPVEYHKLKQQLISLKYGNRDFGELRLDKAKDGSGVLLTIKDEAGDFRVFESYQHPDFYVHNTTIDRHLKYIKEELKEEYGNFHSVIKPQIEALIDTLFPPKDEEEDKSEEGEEYSKEEKEKALEVLNDPLLIQKIRTVLDFKFAGLGKKKLAVFIGCLTKDLEPQRRVSILSYGKWGEGKSIMTEAVLDLFDYERMNSATLASIYRKAEINEKYYNRKILNFGDLGDNINEEFTEVLNVFKQLISEGEIVREILLKNGDDYIPAQLKLTGYPVLVWTAQAPPTDPQHLSRTLPFNVDVSERQRKLVKEFATYQEDTPKELRYPQEVKELETTVKIALKILEKDTKPILNPFAKLINSCMDINSPNVNRDRYKFFGLIAAITHLYQYQRETIEYNKAKYLIVHPVDVLYALYLVEDDFQVLFGALDSITQRGYNFIKEKVKPICESLPDLKARAQERDERADATFELEAKAFTNSELADWLNVSPKTASRINLKLFKKGFITRDKKGKGYNFYVISDEARMKTNGIVLFDSRRMVEGLIGETELRQWLDRTFSDIPLDRYMHICINRNELENTPTPDADVIDIHMDVLWRKSENVLFDLPQTFKYLTENGFVLRDVQRTKEESFKNKGIKTEREAPGKKETPPPEGAKTVTSFGDNERAKCELCGKETSQLFEYELQPEGKKIGACRDCLHEFPVGGEEGKKEDKPKKEKPIREVSIKDLDEDGNIKSSDEGEKEEAKPNIPLKETEEEPSKKVIDKIIGDSEDISEERKPVRIRPDIADEKGQCQICGYGEKWGIELPYLIFYSKTDKSDFKTACERCGKNIMRQYKLVLEEYSENSNIDYDSGSVMRL